MINIAMILLPFVLLCLGFITSFALNDTSFDSAEIDNTTMLNHHNTIITFDLHGVIFTTDYRHLATLLLSSKKTFMLLIHFCHPFVWRDIYTLWRKNSVLGHYFITLTTRHPLLRECLPLLISLANAQKPIPATIELIKLLKEKGYSLHILSNIGPHILDNLQNKFNDIFSNFDIIKTASEQEQYVGKPNHIVFVNYVQQHNPDNKTIIFIDNRLINVKAAQQLGLIGIHFRSAQATQQHLELLINNPLAPLD